MIYLDNSATSYPKPQGVRQAVQRAMVEDGANPGRGSYGMCFRTTQALYGVRQQAADFFGAAGPECVAFQPSCTQALNVVLKGCLKPGDHVVASDLEHNAVMRPLEALKARGITCTLARTAPGDNDATLDAFRKAIGPKTRLVVCTMASNVFGVRLPVERITALAHQYGAKVCVDAAQGAGLVPISLEESGINSLCCAGHKGLYGPMGTGRRSACAGRSWKSCATCTAVWPAWNMWSCTLPPQKRPGLCLCCPSMCGVNPARRWESAWPRRASPCGAGCTARPWPTKNSAPWRRARCGFPLRRLPEGRIWTPWLSKWPAWAGRRPTGPTGLGNNFGESEKRLLFAVFLC